MARFGVGDRVKVRIAVGQVPAGTAGTVVRVLGSITAIYEIRFDGSPAPRFIAEPLLEHATDAPQGRSTR